MLPYDFLEALFAHRALEGQYITIWERQTLATETFELPRIEEAAAHIARRSKEPVDLYVGTCPYLAVEHGKRGKADDAGALVALWLDIDIAGPSHKSKGKPAPNREAADRLLANGPKAPSIVIDSGYGLHAWWLLDEPFLIRDDEDRAEAKRVAEGWVARYQAIALQLGFGVDSVGDLARVLRIPGTYNHKVEGAEPKKVAACH